MKLGIVFLDEYGWPVELFEGRTLINLIRLILHTRSIKRGHWDGHHIVRKDTPPCYGCERCGINSGG